MDLHGDNLYLMSHKDASRFKVLRTSLSHPDIAHAAVVVPASDVVVVGILPLQKTRSTCRIWMAGSAGCGAFLIRTVRLSR